MNIFSYFYDFSGDVTLDKDMDSKTLKQNLYDLKLRIYYMEQKNKYLGDDDGGDIYQKYVDLQVSFTTCTYKYMYVVHLMYSLCTYII